jgi:PHP family Zn ribbon phosphoesterase
MKIIADLQIHSKFSRAVSPEMTIPNIAAWAKRKGIALMATGDWTHPLWFREIERDLEEAGNGLLKLKPAVFANTNLDPSSVGKSKQSIKQDSKEPSEAGLNLIGSTQVFPYFLLATEVSSIFTQNGKGRRVHTLIWVPSMDSARKISQEMTKRGCNLMSDGRPIIPLSCIQVAELVFSIEPKALVIPAHGWTPWFSIFGSMSGFKSIAEAFGDYAKQIYAIETGLSSNPSMNWQIKELDNRQILSFSDAHSGPKIGREATVFDIPDGKLSYDAIYAAIKNNGAVFGNNNLDPSSVGKSKHTIGHDAKEPSEAGLNFITSSRQVDLSNTQPLISFTIEFYPEEGKYHFTGHRACNIRWGPDETRKKGTVCPVCGKPLTQGVVQRVEDLAGRTEADLQLLVHSSPLIENGPVVRMTSSKAFPNRPPFVMLVPLQEIISEAIGSPVASKKTQFFYNKLISELGSEFEILLYTKKEKIAAAANERIALGVEKVRTGDIVIDPGYDGVFGIVKIWKDDDESGLVDKSKEQMGLF